MNVLTINGSLRIGGNSDYIVQHLADKYSDVHFRDWKLRDTVIRHCDGCDICHKNNDLLCNKKDDFLSRVDWMIKSDCILIVSPVYQGGVTALVKLWMDRCEIFRKGRKLSNKLCGGIAIGGYAGGGQELTLMQIQYFAHITAMRYIASWGKTRCHIGGHCIAYNKREVEEDLEGIRSCENIIENMKFQLIS